MNFSQENSSSASVFHAPIESALQFVDASDREIWLRMGMAIKSEMGDAGFDLWEAWSQQADSFNGKDARDVWKSIRAGGGVSIGTLFFEAKANGWRDEGMRQKPTPEELAKRQRKAAERAKKEEAEIARERARTAAKAAAILQAATEAKADHPYLVRKQVSPVAALQEIDAGAAAAILGYIPKSGGEPLTGRLLVVPVEQGDRLSTVELIDGDGRKAALAGRGSKAGGYWANKRLPDSDGTGLTLLIGEGVATVLSASEATGHPAIAALSAGNLLAVAKAMRESYPQAALVMLADLIKTTGEPDQHAVHAAQAVSGKVAVPDFGSDRDPDKKDFNDLAALRGLDAVRAAIASCREGYSGKRPATAKPTPAKVAKQSDAGAAEPWRLELMRRDSGSLLKNHYNAVMIVENAFPGLVGYNEFRQRIEARIPSPWRAEPGQWTEADTGELAFHLAKEFTSFSLDALAAAIMTVAHRHAFNPAQERLRALAEQWDGQSRIGSWLVDYLGAAVNESNRVYLAEIGAAWLKGTVARVLKPGCKRDDVLILRGEQGYLKSTAANAIADCIQPDAFTDSLGNLDSKDAKAAIRGIIIAELGELSVLNKSDLESIKAFVAAKADHFREAYGRGERDYPRTVSFIGTTNHPTFLKDPTGNRRFWPVTIPAPIDIPRLVEVLPQVLGEAARRVLNGEPWFVSDREAMAQANEIRANHFQDDVWTEAVLKAAYRLTIGAEYCTVAEIMTAMEVRIEQQNLHNQQRVGAILRVAGWTDKKQRIGRRSDNKTLRVWYPPVVPLE